MDFIINVFAARFLDNVLQQSSTEGLSVGKLRIVDRIVDKLQTELEPLEHYQLTKDVYTLEKNIRNVMKVILTADKGSRKEVIEKLLSNPSYIEILEEEKYTYGFKDSEISSVKRKHWMDERHPTICIKLTTKEKELLDLIFGSDKNFPEQSTAFVVMISNALENLKEE